MKAESEAYDRWIHVAEMEEDHLKQKSKLHGLEIEDLNNKNLHNVILARKAQNLIREIQGEDGSLVSNQADIKAEAMGFSLISSTTYHLISQGLQWRS